MLLFVSPSRFLRALLAPALAAGALSAVAAPAAAPGKDHPMIVPYAGSTLYMHGDNPHGSVPMLEAGANNGKPVVKPAEGKVANRFYLSAEGAGALEVFRNYQAALGKAGFNMVYQCDDAQCRKHDVISTAAQWGRNATWSEPGNIVVNNAMNSAPEYFYLHARKGAAGAEVDIHMTVRSSRSSSKQAGRIQQFIQVVEAKPVQLGKVTVDAAAIGDALKREGKIALYGILFDTNQAVLKPGSEQTLEEMAKSLKTNAAMKVYIVGHTDNVGDPKANVALSRKRAEAVAAALSARHGIAAGRMEAQGVADFAPVGVNHSEEGRARNRRVEMVAR